MMFSYGRSNFQNGPIFILRPYLESSWKTDNWKYFPFFKILSGTQPKSSSKVKKEGKFTLYIKKCYLPNIRGWFWMGFWRNFEKRMTLSIISFSWGFQIWPQNKDWTILKIWLPIGRLILQGKLRTTYPKILKLKPCEKGAKGTQLMKKCWMEEAK